MVHLCLRIFEREHSSRLPDPDPEWILKRGIILYKTIAIWLL